MMSKKDEYAVGYGKPPRHSQFPKGKSGNPSGKRAGERSMADWVQRELRKTLVITENGKQKRITKQEAIAMRCVQQALQGDPRARKMVLEIVNEHGPSSAFDDLPITFTLKLEEDDDERFN